MFDLEAPEKTAENVKQTTPEPPEERPKNFTSQNARGARHATPGTVFQDTYSAAPIERPPDLFELRFFGGRIPR